MNTLTRKVIKRLKKALNRVVPYNLSYRPSGFYRTIEAYLQSPNKGAAECTEIHPAYTSKSSIPTEFLDKCTKFNELPAVAHIPAARIVSIPGGRLYTDSVEHVSIISSDNKVIGELSYQNKPSKDIEKNILLKQTYFISCKHYKGVVFHTLIGGSGSNNYFHWFVDSLARIHLLKESGWYDKVDWFLIPSKKVSYQKESLRLLGIDESKIIEADRETHIQADTLLATTHVRYHEHFPSWCCAFLRESLVKSFEFSASFNHPHIYISRKDANRRGILNEPELLEMLKEYDFKSFELTSLTLEEKVELFRNAKVIVAPHGAGNTNLIFCNKGTNVVDIIPENFAFPDYYYISEIVGVNYDYLFARPDSQGKTSGHRIQSNMTVDVPALKQKLDNIMVSAATYQ